MIVGFYDHLSLGLTGGDTGWAVRNSQALNNHSDGHGAITNPETLVAGWLLEFPKPTS